jgi:catechol 2,3-dioxygenase-like lactoylglutathione lyase family enzyme
MIDHVYLPVRDLATAETFYLGALAPLGYVRLIQRPGVTGFGAGRKPDFFLREGAPGDPAHVAFAAPDRATVDAFHDAALAAGGIENGPPGGRPEYHAAYYGAFVLDPDGHNVEAVCHTSA